MFMYILVLFTFIILNQIHAATNVSGIFVQNTIWTADASENPYSPIGHIQIPFNSTLTIQRGVIIDFGNGDFEILVKGFLRVEGTLENPVIFKGGRINDQNWMIHFQSTQLSLSSISHAHFIGPKKALQISDVPNGIQENNGTLIIQSSIFSDNTTVGANGIYPRWSNSSVPSLEFQSCIFNQTTISSIDRDSEPITINNSQIYDSILKPRASNEGIQIHNCNITDIRIIYDKSDSSNLIQLYHSNATGIEMISFDYAGSYQFNVRQSIIQNFLLSQYFYSGSWSHSTNVTFEDSTLFNVSVLVFYDNGSFGGPGYTITVRNCIYNTGNLNLSDIWASTLILIINSQLHNVDIVQINPIFTYSNLETRKLVMRNSTFVEGGIMFEKGESEIFYSIITLSKPPLSLNGNSRIICSSISRSDSILPQNTIGINTTGLSLLNSTIKNFAIGVRTYPTYTYKVNITNSNFIGNTLYNIENKAIYDVTTQGVHWGTNGSGVIIQKINDYWNNIKFGHVISSSPALYKLDAEIACRSYSEDLA